jgi:PAS domain S-box-containing protein
MRSEKFHKLFGDDDVYAVLDSVPDTLLIVEGDSNKIIFASRNASIITGYTVDQLCTMTVEDLVPETLREGHVALRSTFQHAPTPRWMGQNRGSLLLRRASGEIRKIEAQLNPVTTQNRSVILAWIRDITDRSIDFDEEKLVRSMLKLYREATTPEQRLDQIRSDAEHAVTP